MQAAQLIVSSPDILGGTPVFSGTHVPIRNLSDYLEAGDSLDEFLSDFPSVSRAQAVEVRQFVAAGTEKQARASG